MDVKTVLEYLMGSSVITGPQITSVSQFSGISYKYPKKIQEADPAHDTCP